MRYALLLILVKSFTTVQGQNLVPNPSFEDYNLIPCRFNEFYIQDLIQHWFQPIPTTTDYWTELSPETCELNPHNIGIQPRTGQGMAGIIIADIVMGNKIEYKEYLEVELATPLKTGELYHAEFYTASQPNPLYCEANNMGIAFSENKIYDFSEKHPDHLRIEPTFNEENIIVADGSWKKIGGCFIPDKPYQYFLAGNFHSIDSTQIRLSSILDSQLGYYLIDDVVVQELPYKIESLAKTYSLCHDETFVELEAYVEGAIGYEWLDGSTSSNFKVEEKVSKDYEVTVQFKECSYKHKFHVDYYPDVSLGKDTTLCVGETILLSPNHPKKEYLWSDGSTDSVMQVSQPGDYIVAVPHMDCSIQDTIAVEFVTCPGFVPNVFTPNSDSLNQHFVFENIESRKWSLTVYNRWGEKVYYAAHYQNDWSGSGMPDGIYYYILSSSGLTPVKGWVNILR